MSPSDIELLERLSRTYGTAEVVRELSTITSTACLTDYADNPQAIIHEYAPVIADAALKLTDVRIHRLTRAVNGVPSLEQMMNDQG